MTEQGNFIYLFSAFIDKFTKENIMIAYIQTSKLNK